MPSRPNLIGIIQVGESQNLSYYCTTWAIHGPFINLCTLRNLWKEMSMQVFEPENSEPVLERRQPTAEKRRNGVQQW